MITIRCSGKCCTPNSLKVGLTNSVRIPDGDRNVYYKMCKCVVQIEGNNHEHNNIAFYKVKTNKRAIMMLGTTKLNINVYGNNFNLLLFNRLILVFFN